MYIYNICMESTENIHKHVLGMHLYRIDHLCKDHMDYLSSTHLSHRVNTPHFPQNVLWPLFCLFSSLALNIRHKMRNVVYFFVFAGSSKTGKHIEERQDSNDCRSRIERDPKGRMYNPQYQTTRKPWFSLGCITFWGAI